MNRLLLREMVNKHYSWLESMINELARVCPGGDKATLVFDNGKVTVELK